MSGEHERTWTEKSAAQIPSTLWPDGFLFDEIKERSRILDVGCGAGALAVHLAGSGHELEGVDLSRDAIAVARREAGQRGVEARCRFQVCSAVALEYSSEFDVAIVQAVLTTVERPSDRRQIMAKLQTALRPTGILYLAEFAQTWHRPDYRRRYLTDESRTGELGLFIVADAGGTEIYRAKHFSQREIVDLLVDAQFMIEKFRHADFRTRSGNVVDGFQVIARPAAGAPRTPGEGP